MCKDSMVQSCFHRGFGDTACLLVPRHLVHQSLHVAASRRVRKNWAVYLRGNHNDELSLRMRTYALKTQRILAQLSRQPQLEAGGQEVGLRAKEQCLCITGPKLRLRMAKRKQSPRRRAVNRYVLR